MMIDEKTLAELSSIVKGRLSDKAEETIAYTLDENHHDFETLTLKKFNDEFIKVKFTKIGHGYKLEKFFKKDNSENILAHVKEVFSK